MDEGQFWVDWTRGAWRTVEGIHAFDDGRKYIEFVDGGKRLISQNKSGFVCFDKIPAAA